MWRKRVWPQTTKKEGNNKKKTSILLFSMKPEVSNCPPKKAFLPRIINVYRHIYIYIWSFRQLTLSNTDGTRVPNGFFLLMVFSTKSITISVCSNDKIFPGIISNSDAISKAKSDELHNQPSMCYVGVQCGHYCMADSSEWNFFEVRKISPPFSNNF